MKKKLVSLFIVTAMLTTALVGCGNVETSQPSETNVAKPAETDASKSSETNAPKERDWSEAKFSVMLKSTAEDASVYPIHKLISEGTGIYPDYVEISPAAADEQYSLMWMSGNYEDVIVGAFSGEKVSDLYKYASEGILIDLAPYMTEEIMPNFCKYLEASEIDRLKDSEGHIYGFPFLQPSRIQTGMCINQEWLNKLGLKMPETPEELKAVWTAFKEKDPNGNGVADEIPFSSELVWSNALETMNPMFGMFGACGGWQVDDSGKVFFGQATDEYKEGVKFFQECYKAGLIDAEIFTQDMTSFTAKAQSENPIFGSTLSFVWSAYTRSFTEATVDQYTHLLPMKGEDGVRRWTTNSDAATTISYMAAITSACEDPEAVCHWIDYMYDPYISVQIDQIPEGYGFILGENGWILDQEVYKDHEELKDYASFADFHAALHTNAYPRTITDYAYEQAGFKQDTSNNIIEKVHREKDMLLRENCQLINYMVQDAPTEEESETEAMYLTEFNAYWRAQIATFITSDLDVDAQWDSFIDGLNGVGLQKLTDVYQARYDRY